MRGKILSALLAGGVVFVIEEIRAFRLLEEFNRRFDEQNVRHASQAEKIELLEESIRPK